MVAVRVRARLHNPDAGLWRAILHGIRFMTLAYIGLGSNLQEPARQLHAALASLAETPGITRLQASPFYRSVAIGPGEQPDYVNAVAAIDTSLSPLSLLDVLQAIEQTQGRVRGTIRWTARTLDLDLLLYGDQIIDNDRLFVPHPRMHERNFVLRPLLDLAPDLRLPDGTSAAALQQACGDAGIALLE